MILPASIVTKIVTAKPRSYLLIQNRTYSTLWFSRHEFSDTNDYIANSVEVIPNSDLVINPCIYQGDFYGYSTDKSDIRVLEL